jgi:hypothetical protein
MVRLGQVLPAALAAPRKLASQRPRLPKHVLPEAVGGLLVLLAFTVVASPGPGARVHAQQAGNVCERYITADVVAFDQPIVYNRLGDVNPVGMIYALRRDVVPKSGSELAPGNVQLRPDKRPRPLTLRMNEGDCLQVSFQNYLDPQPLTVSATLFDPVTGTSPILGVEQPDTRAAGFHVNGLQLVGSIASDGSNVGANESSLVAPGGTAVYTFYGEHESTNLAFSSADNTSGEGLNGTFSHGLFGAVTVEPRGSEWYRSQLTAAEMALAQQGAGLFDYDVVYPDGPFAGQPVVNISRPAAPINGTPARETVHSDLTAIITGPNKGSFPPGTYPPNPTYPNRLEPFREFTIIFHDEFSSIQAFGIFGTNEFQYTVHGVRDAFAVNYGSGAVGPEIAANRLGVGPMWDCVECKFEEFFLTSWAVGDPAMIVDVPANFDGPDADFAPDAGPKATEAFYPDDPSNVYHSYLNDHVKFRNLHAGSEHHVFHLHAHQWLFTPNDDNSNYLDSQGIGPGSGYTYEIAYGGSGNRNQTPGDAIFHCHFYPHFAQGMWSLWRVHDVFEDGTRKLPDGEIADGTPIPGVVPLPTKAMAPEPGANVTIVPDAQIAPNGNPAGSEHVVEPLVPEGPLGNPGYPFWIAAESGHRPPTPPLDIVDDGGLPRHIITGGTATHVVPTPYDFSKELHEVAYEEVPEAGTVVEQAAMAFHAETSHASVTPDGSVASFKTNGLPPTPGAPYADPCRTDAGEPIAVNRTYKGANIQIDMKLNKKGWHHPQARIIALWEDVQAMLDETMAPEPFVMRANTGDCVVYHHTNLVPHNYEQDAFQVKTPTDIIGQHIHLVKFDVTSADGSANGYNYEDGTFSPGEIRERIRAIRLANLCTGEESGDPRDATFECPVPEPHPYFSTVLGLPQGLGARTSIQKWWVDPVVNNAGVDRGLGNVFTHDHYGPSSFQQVGLYATLLTEPAGSTWRHPETGVMLGQGRADGGPTSWHADILTADPAHSHREAYFEFSDFQLAYEAGHGVDAQGNPIPDPQFAINQPARDEVGLPDLFGEPALCPNGAPFLPLGCPEAIAVNDDGTFTVNNRNEPLALRVRDPNTNSQALGLAGDLSYAFSSQITRADPDMNQQPNFYPPLTADLGPLDPYTPMIRAYDGDRVNIRVQVGATEEMHNVSINGVRWLQEYASPNSGWRNSQTMGISEQFQLGVPITPAVANPDFPSADYLYTISSSSDGIWNGDWGILRSYQQLRGDLLPLPNGLVQPQGLNITNASDFTVADGPGTGVCPPDAPLRTFDISAVTAADALPGGTLVYNPRGETLHDPTAIMYVRSADLDAQGRLLDGVPVEPLVLRAAAGDCIIVTLTNRLPSTLPDLDAFNAMPPIIDGFNFNDVDPSRHVGLRPQMVEVDVTGNEGSNVGRNRVATAAPGEAVQYTWYGGEVRVENGTLVAEPIEFGATNLISSDRIKHSAKGAIGALIIEPQGATWTEDATSRASATVQAGAESFREFVLIFQTDVGLRTGEGLGTEIPLVAESEDPEDTGNKAFNYRTEPMWFRLGIDPASIPGVAPEEGGPEPPPIDFSTVLDNDLVGGDPVTPIFRAQPGTPVRFRVLAPGGKTRSSVFTLHGHQWQREPYINGSSAIGLNPLSEWKGTQEGHGPTSHWDIVLDSAGGAAEVPGDYLYRDFSPFLYYNGLWGIFRVQAAVPDAPTNVGALAGDAQATVFWTAPADGGSPITSYLVRTFDAAGNPTSIPDKLVTGTPVPTSTVITGLTNGTAYRFAVHATNASGDGPFSALSGPVTPAAPSGPRSHQFSAVALGSEVAIFGRTTVNELWFRETSGGVFGDWALVSGGVASRPEAVSVGTDLYVFFRGPANDLRYVTRSGVGGWSALQTLGGIVVGHPVAAVDSSGNLVVIALNGTDQVWYRVLSSGGTWGAWTMMDGALRGQLSLVSDGTNVELAGINAAGNTWTRTWNGSNWGTWNGLGGVLAHGPAPTVSAGDLHLFGINPAGQSWQRVRTGGSWGPWIPLDGILVHRPDAMTAGATVIYSGVNGAGAPWERHGPGVLGPWSALGGQLAAGPELQGVGGDGYLFGVNSAGTLWYQRFSGGAWGGWQSLGGVLAIE